MDDSYRRYLRRWILEWVKDDGRVNYTKRVLRSRIAKDTFATPSARGAQASPSRVRRTLKRTVARGRPPGFNAGYEARPTHLNQYLPKARDY